MSESLFEITARERSLSAVEPVFARHETFHPRYGWLKKGFDAAIKHPDVFIRSDATTTLGVGKNMVRAIRFWCDAYKVLEETPDPERPRMRNARPTEFGRNLLVDQGWDPYLEDRGSLWLLHWQLFRAPCLAPTWYAAFNALPAVEFTAESRVSHARVFCDAQDGWPSTVSNSLKKDVRCFLRMFASATSGRDLPEDSVDSPFGELGLIYNAGDSHHYRFRVGAKDDLPDCVVAHACLDFAATSGATAMISVSRLAHATGSPGRAFKLPEAALGQSLSRAFADEEDVALTDVGGATQLVFGREPAELGHEILVRYYDTEHAAAEIAA